MNKIREAFELNHRALDFAYSERLGIYKNAKVHVRYCSFYKGYKSRDEEIQYLRDTIDFLPDSSIKDNE